MTNIPDPRPPIRAVLALREADAARSAARLAEGEAAGAVILPVLRAIAKLDESIVAAVRAKLAVEEATVALLAPSEREASA